MNKSEKVEDGKIVYIMGSGRSGSTLLGILLGNEPGVFCAGELTRYPRRGGIPPNIEYDRETYKFWTRIKKKIGQDEAVYSDLDTLCTSFEHHSGFLASYFHWKKKQDELQYGNYLKTFFKTLFSERDERIIVDTSKYPARILNMDRYLEYQLYIIYIIRNPIGVLRSFEKEKLEQPSKHWIASLVYYFFVNYFCYLTIKRLSPQLNIMTIRYEDLIRSPRKVIDRICDQTGISFPVVDKKLVNDEYFETGNLFDGNRIRLKNKIKLRSEQIGIEATNLREKIMSAVNSFWWSKTGLEG